LWHRRQSGSQDTRWQSINASASGRNVGTEY
jgi:hypothetical protein